MPVIINGVRVVRSLEPVPGRPRFNAALKELAPLISQIRAQGHHGISEIADCLNAQGVQTLKGKPFSYTTMQRILHRLKRLGLGDGLRTVSQAASRRPSRPRPSLESRQREMASVLASMRREHPASKAGLHEPSSKPQ